MKTINLLFVILLADCTFISYSQTQPAFNAVTSELLAYKNSAISFKTTAHNQSVLQNETLPEIKSVKKESLGKGKSATASGQVSSSESSLMACDGNESTKWCQVVEGDKWLIIDLGKPMNISEWKVIHAGGESTTYITKDFKLQKLIGVQWVNVDSVSDNTLNITERFVAPFIAQKVRLYITNSGQINVARIYEFQVFGSEQK